MQKSPIRLNLFANLKSYASTQVSLDEIIRLLRYDSLIHERTLQYRSMMEAMGKQTANKNIKEKFMPVFSVAVTFKGLGHSIEQAASWTGLAMCDIDGVDGSEELEATFKRLTHDPHVLLMYRSIGGKGLHVLYRYQREGGQRIDDTSWRAAFLFGNEQLSLVAGHAYDAACGDATRLSGMASDPDLYYNPESVPYRISDDLIVTENCEYQEHGKPRMVYSAGTNVAGPADAWSRIQQMLSAKGLSWAPHQHHDYVLHAAYLFNRFGVPLDQLLVWAEQEWSDYDEQEREAAIRHKYKDVDNFGTWKLNVRDKSPKKVMMTLPDIRSWLTQKIAVSYNLVTDQMSYRMKGSCETWKKLDNLVINTLRCQLAEDSGKHVTPTDLKTVLESYFAQQIHPVREYLQQLPLWDGCDRVGELAGHVYVEATTAFKTDAEAQESFQRALHKWLVAMVATWSDDEVANHEILTLIGPQGIYKTTFFRHILPPQLHGYFWENAHNSFHSKDDKIALTENCLVEIEEVEAVEGTEMSELKGLVTSQYIKERRPYAVYREQKPRMASFCASGNEQKILTDKTGTRRWLCYLVSSIDDPRQWQLDYDQLYAQLYQEYLDGFCYYLTDEEERLVEQHNKPFKRVSPEEELITSRLRKPKGNESFKLMSATMISVFLTGGVNHGLNIHKISEALRGLKFRSCIRRGCEFYRVVEIPYDRQQDYLQLSSEGERCVADDSQTFDYQKDTLPF